MDQRADDRRRSQPGSRSWEAEYFELAEQDRHAPLEPAKLERMAMAAVPVPGSGGGCPPPTSGVASTSLVGVDMAYFTSARMARRTPR